MDLTTEMRTIVEKLIDRTAANEIMWRAAADELTAVVAGTVFSIARDPKTKRLSLALSTGGPPLYKVGDGDEGEDGKLLGKLYTAAVQAAMSTVLAQVQGALGIGNPADQTIRPAAIPSGEHLGAVVVKASPSTAQIKRIFDTLQGEWNLHIANREEHAKITSSGEYYVLGGPVSGLPKFRLNVLACSPDLSAVEVAKDYLDGRRDHTEFLHLRSKVLSPGAEGEEFDGEVTATGRKLKYIRVKPSGLSRLFARAPAQHGSPPELTHACTNFRKTVDAFRAAWKFVTVQTPREMDQARSVLGTYREQLQNVSLWLKAYDFEMHQTDFIVEKLANLTSDFPTDTSFLDTAVAKIIDALSAEVRDVELELEQRIRR
jgi:hypothetical protein